MAVKSICKDCKFGSKYYNQKDKKSNKTAKRGYWCSKKGGMQEGVKSCNWFTQK